MSLSAWRRARSSDFAVDVMLVAVVKVVVAVAVALAMDVEQEGSHSSKTPCCCSTPVMPPQSFSLPATLVATRAYGLAVARSTARRGVWRMVRQTGVVSERIIVIQR